MSDLTQDEAFLTAYADLAAAKGRGGPADLGWALSVAGTPADAAHFAMGAAGRGPITLTLAQGPPAKRGSTPGGDKIAAICRCRAKGGLRPLATACRRAKAIMATGRPV